METLLRPVIISTSSRPAATASSTTYWIAGLSTTGSISLGVAFVAGRNRVPRPAAGMTALEMAGREAMWCSSLSLCMSGADEATLTGRLPRDVRHGDGGRRGRRSPLVQGQHRGGGLLAEEQTAYDALRRVPVVELHEPLPEGGPTLGGLVAVPGT